jgi:hypothetical protein
MFRSASDHHQGVELYLAKNYSSNLVVFLGYWLCGSTPLLLQCNSAFIGYNKRL